MTNFRIAEVAIRVADLDRSAAFYTEVLGFKHHLRQDGVIFLEIGPLDSPLGDVDHPQLFALFSRGRDLAVAGSTFDHIAFEVPEEDYERELERFRTKEMVIHERAWPETLPWNGRSFFFRDPDGNVIEIITANRIGGRAISES